jgi:four helix bundle protein
LWVWQLSQELKVAVDALLESGPITAKRHAHFRNKLRQSAANAPQAVAEGFARQLPRDFSVCLKQAVKDLTETFAALQAGCDRGCFTEEQVVALRRLATRASSAISALIRYLQMADAPPVRRPRPALALREGQYAAS